MPASIDEAEKVRLTNAYTKAIQQTIVPTYRKLHSFLKEEYLPTSRASVGISALPGGSAWYAYLVKAATTTNLTADEIFQIGMDEIKRVKKEMEELREKTGFKGKGGFETYLEQNAPKYSNKEDLIKAYEGLRTKVTPRVRQLFSRLPKASYEIRAVEGLGEEVRRPFIKAPLPMGPVQACFISTHSLSEAILCVSACRSSSTKLYLVIIYRNRCSSSRPICPRLDATGVTLPLWKAGLLTPKA